MKISRRDFLKYCISSAAILGLDATVVGKLRKALAANTGPHVIWLAGSACTGCSVSLANLISTSAPRDVADLLVNVINLDFHPNLMGTAGDEAVQALRNAAAGSYILAVEGGIPSAYNGNACILWNENGTNVTALTAVRDLASRSIANLAIGTCASYGGVAAASPNPTQVASLSSASGRPTINIAGCPPHPDWIVYVIAQLIAGTTPTLDTNGRPTALFGSTVHSRCPRREGSDANTYGTSGCLEPLGCKGPDTRADCPNRLWNNRTSTCINVNALCVGCTERTFPAGPLYRVTTTSTIPAQSPLAVNSASWNSTSLVLTAAGTGKIGSQAVVKTTAGTLVTSTMIKRDGTWSVSKAGLSSVPSSIVVLSNGASVTANVVNAPGGGQTFTIASAQYTASSNQLTVVGTGIAGASVTVNVTGGSLLGAVTVPTNGSWTLTVTSPASIPQSITAVSNGVTRTASVTGIPTGPAFAISSAQYMPAANQLAVSGTGASGASVTVRVTGGSSLGAATIASNGSWALTITSPSPVPQSVTAVCNGVTLTAAVTGIPTGPVFVITRAAWIASSNTLQVNGTAPSGRSIIIGNLSGVFLGQATANSSGNWSVSITNLTAVPQTITATSNSVTLSAVVQNAPVPSAAALRITRAEWESEDRRLEVRGRGSVGATVRIYNGTLLGSVTIPSTGEWRWRRYNTSYFRTVRAESNGQSVEAYVRVDD